MKKKVLVLLASYNGEKFIREQIESILNQKNVEVSLLISDDNSSDNTKEILEEYVDRNKNIQLITSKCGSAQKNFYKLINNASLEYDYYALSDQDDFWLQDKLCSAINFMDKYSDNIPILYSSESTLVNNKLEEINTYKKKHHLVDTIESAIIACNTQGSTMVMNKKLLANLKNRTTHTQIMHDGWIHRTCLILGGKIIFDPVSHIYYRQHENNVFATAGKKNNLLMKIKNKFLYIFSRKNYNLLSSMINEWEKNFEKEICKDALIAFNEIKASKNDFRVRFKIFLSKKYRSKYKIDYIKFIYLILIGKI